MESVELSADFLSQQDAVIIATDHSNVDYESIVRSSSLVIDTRNATVGVKIGREKIRKTWYIDQYS